MTRRGFTLIELLVTLAIMALLTGLTLGAVQRVRQAAARAVCADRLRQLALAAHNYHSVHARFPAGQSPSGPSVPQNALPASAWTAHLLPHLEQVPLWDAMIDSYRTTPDVTSAAHTGRAVAVAAFVCPSDGRLATSQLAIGERVQVGLMSYLGVAGTASWRKDGVLFSGRGVRLNEVTDGTSNTLFAGERPPDERFDLGWWYAGRGIDGAGTFDMHMGVAENDPSPLTATACGLPVVPFGPAAGVGDRCGTFHFWSLHPGGAHFALCDGSVRFLRYSAGPTLRPLATRAAGDTAALD